MGLLQLSRQLFLSHASVQEQEGGIDVGAVALLGENLPLLVSELPEHGLQPILLLLIGAYRSELHTAGHQDEPVLETEVLVELVVNPLVVGSQHAEVVVLVHFGVVVDEVYRQHYH